jgi:hypothetical protein
MLKLLKITLSAATEIETVIETVTENVSEIAIGRFTEDATDP